MALDEINDELTPAFTAVATATTTMAPKNKCPKAGNDRTEAFTDLCTTSPEAQSHRQLYEKMAVAEADSSTRAWNATAAAKHDDRSVPGPADSGTTASTNTRTTPAPVHSPTAVAAHPSLRHASTTAATMASTAAATARYRMPEAVM